MDKQELIERIEDFPCEASLVTEMIRINKNTLLGWVKELDEPQKPVVPQFVADWYEENKDDFERNLFRSINTISSMYEDEELNEFEDWVIGAYTKPFQTLVNMHQFGYEVEKEKRYVVKMKGISSNMCYLNRVGNKWIITGIDEHTGMNIYTKHTKKQLEEAGFGDVFNSPLFEVEEVLE